MIIIMSSQSMYKYEGICHGAASRDSWGGIYHVRICARLFSPFCSVAVSFPLRMAEWRLKSDVFDYRAAAISGALPNTG